MDVLGGQTQTTHPALPCPTHKHLLTPPSKVTPFPSIPKSAVAILAFFGAKSNTICAGPSRARRLEGWGGTRRKKIHFLDNFGVKIVKDLILTTCDFFAFFRFGKKSHSKSIHKSFILV